MLIASAASAQIAPVRLPPPADLTRPQAPINQHQFAPEIRAPLDIAIPPDAETVIVNVTSISLDGVTAYGPNALASYYAGLDGRRVALADIFRAAAQIEARYHRDGYVLARAIVPAQQTASGSFHISVVEGYVDAIQLNGGGAGDSEIIRRYFNPVLAAKPMRIGDLERALLLVNALPGISAHAVLTPEKGVLGAARLIIDVRRKPVDAYATVNNRGSHFAGPVTGTVGADLNLPNGVHVGGLFFTTFDHEQNYGEVSADAKIGDDGLKLRGWMSDATSNPGSILAPLNIQSRSLVGGVGFDYPIVLTRALTVSTHGSFEVTDDRTHVLSAPQSQDRQRILRFGIDVQTHDVWQGVTSFSLTGHKGLDILDASNDRDQVPQSRLGGRSDFVKVTGTVTRLQPLVDTRWGAITLQLSAAGQYAGDKLLALEQFHVGGEEFGRGFNPSQFSGDNGAASSLELQFTHNTPIAPFTAEQLYGFFDAAAVEDRGLDHWTEIQSAGAGLRVDLGPRISGQLEVAVPYRGGRQDGSKLDRSAQGFFRLTARY